MQSTYSIKDLERISGIKAHTLRIWEQRYGILRPERTDTNIRRYSHEDLKYLLSISLLNQRGIKISKISALTTKEVKSKVHELFHAKSELDYIDALIVCMMELDEHAFESILTRAIAEKGLVACLEEIVYPFFERIGILWLTDSIKPAQEHFITHLLRRKLIVGIDKAMASRGNGHSFLLFLPERELHEIGLLVAHLILSEAGHNVIYLGQSVPFDDLEAITNQVSPDYIFTMFTNPIEASELLIALESLAELSVKRQVLVSGPQLNHLEGTLPPKITWVKSPSSLLKSID